jgi:hypothetical protein
MIEVVVYVTKLLKEIRTKEGVERRGKETKVERLR